MLSKDKIDKYEGDFLRFFCIERAINEEFLTISCITT